METDKNKFGEVEDFLFALRNAGSKYSLDRIRRMCALFGNPQDKFPTIHVAGTNGKGSVCAMLERILRGSGLKVGMFTSPHLVYLGERVQIDRIPIERKEIISLIAEIRATIAPYFNESDLSSYPSFFEYMTLLAFIYFERKNVDCAVIEVGLGGRLDSTNVLRPQICAITSIGLDHIQMLGATYAEIAREKAGIIKSQTPVVIGWLPEDAQKVIEQKSTQENAPLYKAQNFFIADNSLPQTSLPGFFQRKNAAVAKLCIQTLRKCADLGSASKIFAGISDSSIDKSLADVSWAARWQTIILSNGARLILDASHNEEGARALDSNLKVLCTELEKSGNPKPVISVGVLGRERAIPLLGVVAKYARKIILLRPNQPRALDFSELRECMKHTEVPIVQSQVDKLYLSNSTCTEVQNGDTIVCTGSIYLAGEVLSALTNSKCDDLQDHP